MNSDKPNPTLTHSKRSRSFSMQTEFCPLCSKDGHKVRVKAYQINLEEAVFMCSTNECTWPVGYHELLFMDRPLGKYNTEDWPEVADKYLANYLQKQHDSLSELSAYTPPQTPGNCKDAIHDTSTAGNSALPVIRLDDLLEPQPSTSESKDYELPVIDLVGDDMPSYEDKVVSLAPLVVPKSEKIVVIKKDGSGVKLTPKNITVLANPFVKHSVTVVDKKPVIIKEEKAYFGLSGRSLGSDNVQSKKFRIIGKKTKSFTYKKQFDIFDDIKKAKSTNEQCNKDKAAIAIKNKIDLDKMKPNEIKEVLFVNSKANSSKVESNINKRVSLEVKQELVKEEKKVLKVLRDDVNSSSVGVEKDKGGNFIQILDSDSNASVESLNKQCSIDQRVQNDLDVAMKATEFESNESWSETDGLESLLLMLEDSPSDSSQAVNDQMVVLPSEGLNCNALTSNITLPSKPLNCNALMSNATLPTVLTNCNASLSNVILSTESTSCNALTSNATFYTETMNDNLSSSNGTLQSESSKEKKIDNDVVKDKIMEVDPRKDEMDDDSLMEEDTLECDIDDDSLFADMFSPPTN